MTIDFLSVADNPRDGSQSPGHTHGAGVGKARKPAGKHTGIEFIRLAVHIHIRPWEVDADNWKSAPGEIGDNLVHE